MWYLLLKILVSAVLIGIISEVSRRSTLLGGLLATLPITSLMAFIWLYLDTKDKSQVIELSHSIFWFIISSLSFFISFPLLLKRLSFEISVVLSLAIMLATHYTMVFVLSRFGITL